MPLADLKKKIAYEFANEDLLIQALTHSSYANEILGNRSMGNERLEFLGDTILDTVIGVYLFRICPEKEEGELTKLKAEIVCENSLAQAAREMDLPSYLRMSRGEERGGGRQRNALIADAVESLIGAVYLDGGIEAAGKVIHSIMDKTVAEALSGRLSTDYKSNFQQYIQKKTKCGTSVIHYEVVRESGPDHAKHFEVAVFVNEEECGSGSGSTKKHAEQQAAKNALEKLGER